MDEIRAKEIHLMAKELSELKKTQSDMLQQHLDQYIKILNKTLNK